jgi:7,8-dihydropterin-6-yl-methyl-4-(beta-D-ribofuranosyl)aminobenzene 5'-phosphate synthase
MKMIELEVILMSNNCVLPFHDLSKKFEPNFFELTKTLASHCLAEHGLGFLLNIYERDGIPTKSDNEAPVKKLIFDTGGPNLTFLHNLDLYGYQLYDLDLILLSHWHDDHTGALYKILERVNKEMPILCHINSKCERYHSHTKDFNFSTLLGKSRAQIDDSIASSMLSVQAPLNIEKVSELGGKPMFLIQDHVILNKKDFKLTLSGEIPRMHEIESFQTYSSFNQGKIDLDIILDDKFLLIEFANRAILICGCCHSGLMNTLDHCKKLTKKPISHIIGGLHMANASEERILKTVEFISNFQAQDQLLTLFPIHCSGEKIIDEINRKNIPSMKAFNLSVGSTLTFFE